MTPFEYFALTFTAFAILRNKEKILTHCVMPHLMRHLSGKHK